LLILPSMLRSLMFSMPATMRQHLYSCSLRPYLLSNATLRLPRHLSHYTAPQSDTSSRYLPPSHFADFDKVRVALSGAPITEWELLQSHYNLPLDRVRIYSQAYHDWHGKMRALERYQDDIGLLLHRDLRDPQTIKMLREAHDRTPNNVQQFGSFDNHPRWSANLCVTEPLGTPYFTPPTISVREFDVDLFAPFLWSNIDFVVPTTRPHAGIPIHHPIADGLKSSSSFTTKLIHLGMIEFQSGRSSILPAPYCAVAKASATNDGTIDGIFTFPVDYRPDDECPKCGHRKYGTETWEPKVRGLYYLGRDFDDVVRRKRWELCLRLDDRDVEVVRSELGPGRRAGGGLKAVRSREAK